MIQFSPVPQSCPTLRDTMDCSTPGPLSITNSRSLLKVMCIESVMPSNHLILCHPLLLLPSIFPRIRVFSNEWVLCIRRPSQIQINRSFRWSHVLFSSSRVFIGAAPCKNTGCLGIPGRQSETLTSSSYFLLGLCFLPSLLEVHLGSNSFF